VKLEGIVSVTSWHNGPSSSFSMLSAIDSNGQGLYDPHSNGCSASAGGPEWSVEERSVAFQHRESSGRAGRATVRPCLIGSRLDAKREGRLARWMANDSIIWRDRSRRVRRGDESSRGRWLGLGRCSRAGGRQFGDRPSRRCPSVANARPLAPTRSVARREPRLAGCRSFAATTGWRAMAPSTAAATPVASARSTSIVVAPPSVAMASVAAAGQRACRWEPTARRRANAAKRAARSSAPTMDWPAMVRRTVAGIKAGPAPSRRNAARRSTASVVGAAAPSPGAHRL